MTQDIFSAPTVICFWTFIEFLVAKTTSKYLKKTGRFLFKGEYFTISFEKIDGRYNKFKLFFCLKAKKLTWLHRNTNIHLQKKTSRLCNVFQLKINELIITSFCQKRKFTYLNSAESKLHCTPKTVRCPKRKKANAEKT